MKTQGQVLLLFGSSRALTLQLIFDTGGLLPLVFLLLPALSTDLTRQQSLVQPSTDHGEKRKQ